jgi:hypothetical protein
LRGNLSKPSTLRKRKLAGTSFTDIKAIIPTGIAALNLGQDLIPRINDLREAHKRKARSG